MNLQVRPKLYPPKALLRHGPTPAAAFAPRAIGASTLPPEELRRIVREWLG